MTSLFSAFRLPVAAMRRCALVAAATAFCLLAAAAAQEAPPVVALTEPFTFAVIADPHCAEKARFDLYPYDPSCGTHVDRLLRCIAEMEKLAGADRPDFVLVAGDVHPQELAKHIGTIRMPLHLIAGNHETGKLKEQLRGLCPEDFHVGGSPSDYYSFVHKGCRFIGVCTSGRGGDHVGHLCSEDIRPLGQCEWLERELAQPEARKFVFSHIPPQPDGLDQNSYMSRNDSRYFNELVTRTRPTAMFFGHQHRATREYPIGETRCFVLRSCAWNTGNTPLGFMLVRVTGTGIQTREVFTSSLAK